MDSYHVVIWISIYSDPGEWTSWEGMCSVTCGEGTITKTRVCDSIPGSPPPPGCEPTCEGLYTVNEVCRGPCCPSKLHILIEHVL